MDINKNNFLLKIKKIFFKEQVAYLHIPKTGGTYLSSFENNKELVLSPLEYLGHTYIYKKNKENPIYSNYDAINAKRMTLHYNQLSNKYITATIRNIYTWLVSYYYHASGINHKYANPNHYDYINANKGFEYLIKTLINREDIWPCRKFIFCQLFADNGDFIVNWLNHTNTLDEDLLYLSKVKQLKYKKLPPQRVSLKRTRDFRLLYSDELLNLVQDTWAREINLYGFNLQKAYSADWKHQINPVLKQQIKYHWSSDTLSL